MQICEQVEKFEISKEDYEKRSDSVLAYKQKHKIGRFAEFTPEQLQAQQEQEEAYKDLASQIIQEDRCLVELDGLEKKGTVKFVGKVDFQKGYWVGIQYDEPLGKHNGT